MYGWQELAKSMDRNTKARQENTVAMNKLALVVEQLYTQQFAVPTYVNTSDGIKMNLSQIESD